MIVQQWPNFQMLFGRICYLLFFLFDDGAAHVVAAVRADVVRGHRVAALGAVGELLGLLMIVSAAAPGFLIRLTSLRNGHGNFLLGNGLWPLSWLAFRPNMGWATRVKPHNLRLAAVGCQDTRRRG